MPPISRAPAVRQSRPAPSGGRWAAGGAAALAMILALLPAPAAAPEPCKLAKGNSPVAKACAEGGIPAAKEVMKSMLQQGRAAGVKLECDQCHRDPAKYDVLTDDAREKFKKLQQAIEPKPAPPAK